LPAFSIFRCFAFPRQVSRKFLLILLFFATNAYSQCTTVSTFPYLEGFETSMGLWTTGGVNNDWSWSSPAKPTISAAGAGLKCWVVGGPVASFYNLGERSWVMSPCFDFTTLNNPFVSFLAFWETERTYDGANFQYSTDGGTTWITVGTVNETDTCSSHNWYNVPHITNLTQITTATQGWSGTIQPSNGSCNGGGGSGGWKKASHCLKFLAHESSVKFRFTFGSGTTCNDYDGFAFDEVYIGEAPSLSSDFSFTCLANDRYQFKDIYSACRNGWSWNFDDPSSADNFSNSASPIHTFSHSGVFNIAMTVNGGCASDTTITKQIVVKDATVQTTDETCIGSSDGSAVVSVTHTTGAVTYQWSHNPNLNSNSATGLSSGLYHVNIIDSFCALPIDITISYSQQAAVAVSLGDDTTLCPGTKFILDPGKFSSYRWQDNSVDSFYVVETAGIFSVVVKNNSGCSGSDSIEVREDCLNDILFPNTFTPNGDGINEFFSAAGSMTDEFEIFIYDRWGQMIFSSPDRISGWDGTAKGRPVQEGFYSYVVNYSIGNEERVKTGSVLVIR
jgi:gliding motility-associated-like protein